MAKMITAIVTADESEGFHRNVNGAEQLVYPVHASQLTEPAVEGFHPGKIVNALLEIDLEDLIDVLHQFVPEMAVDAWVANIQRLKEIPPE
jgi:hypothetical protein